MLEWIARGLGIGGVTTAYPRRPETAPDVFRGRVEVILADDANEALEDVCPTGAITVEEERVSLDRARCILCGACVAAEPARFRFVPTYETASRSRGVLVSNGSSADQGDLRPPLGERARPLKRSVHVRHVDAGSDGSEEWEIAALANPFYDMQRLGLYFTASPRHADVLLVTGPVTEPMVPALERAFEVMPEPKAVVAAGTDACSGGFDAARPGTLGGVDRLLPVDVYVPGSPPSPIALLQGLLMAAGIVQEEAR